MANSKRALIINAIRDTVLPAITTAGGYNYNLTTISRGLQQIDAVPDSSYPAVFLGRSTEVRQNLTRIQFEGRISLIIVGYVKADTAGNGAQAALDNLIEDLTKALEQDRTQGGLAKWTEIKTIDTDDGDLENLAACAITAEIVYVSEGINP
jgi:hypothetical protein